MYFNHILSPFQLLPTSLHTQLLLLSIDLPWSVVDRPNDIHWKK